MIDAPVTDRDRELAMEALRRALYERRREADVLAQAIANARFEGFHAALRLQEDVEKAKTGGETP